VHVAYPAYDRGIDLLAYREADLSDLVPIQVKARSGSCYHTACIDPTAPADARCRKNVVVRSFVFF
jgi:hypothetical protein